MHSSISAASAVRKQSSFSTEKVRIAAVALTAVLVTILVMLVVRPDAESNDQQFRKLPLHIEGVVSIDNPSLSPDRNGIYFRGRDSSESWKEYLFEFEDRRLIEIADLKPGWVAFSRESPDGLHLAYQSAEGLWLKPLPFGEPEELDPLGIFPIWLDDNTIVYKRITGSGLHEIDLETRQVSEFIAPDTTGQTDFERFIYHFYPDHGAALVGREYVDGRLADLYWTEIPGSQETLIGPGMINAFLLNDSHLLFQSGDNDDPWMLQPFNLDSRKTMGSPIQVFSAIDWQKIWASTTGDVLVAEPDLCPASAELVEFDLNSGTTRSIVQLADGCYRHLSISENGNSFAFTYSEIFSSLNYELVVGSVVDGEYAVVQDDDSRTHAEFSRDGNRLIVSIRDGAGLTNIYSVSTSGMGTPELVVENGYDPDISHHANTMAFGRRDGDVRQVWVLNLNSGEESLLDSNTTSAEALRISPDGSKVIYAREQESEYWVVDVETGIKEILSDHMIDSWMPDSRSIMSLEDSRLYRQAVYLENGSFIIGPREYLDNVDASDWQEFRISPSSGKLIVYLGGDPYEGKNHTVLEWWQNFDTQLERIAPTPDR